MSGILATRQRDSLIKRQFCLQPMNSIIRRPFILKNTTPEPDPLIIDDTLDRKLTPEERAAMNKRIHSPEYQQAIAEAEAAFARQFPEWASPQK